MGPLLLSLFAAGALAGEPLLVPDFTPDTPSEVALAAMLEGLVADELERDGHILIKTEHARPVVGDIIDRCGQRQGCPYVPLQKLPARFAVVVTITRLDDALTGTVDFYEQADPTPIATKAVPIEPGNEAEFAAEIRRETEDLLGLLGPAPKEDLVEAVRLVDGVDTVVEVSVPQPVPVPVPMPGPAPVPAPQPVVPAPVPVIPMDPVEAKLSATTTVYERHIAGSRNHFKRYDEDADTWVYRLTPHAGRFYIEARGGAGFGDISRVADVRLISGDPVTEWYQEGPNSGTGPRAGFAAGYAPVTFMDIGLLVEIQTGTKTLSTGFDSEAPANTSGSAIQAVVQPRARFYIAPLGPVKPALVVGAEIRAFDAYRIDPNPDSFPEPPGGAVPGALGGLSLVIDPVPVVGIVLESTYTQHFGLRAQAAQDGRRPENAPDAVVGKGFTMGFTGGIQFRI